MAPRETDMPFPILSPNRFWILINRQSLDTFKLARRRRRRFGGLKKPFPEKRTIETPHGWFIYSTAEWTIRHRLKNLFFRGKTRQKTSALRPCQIDNQIRKRENVFFFFSTTTTHSREKKRNSSVCRTRPLSGTRHYFFFLEIFRLVTDGRDRQDGHEDLVRA